MSASSPNIVDSKSPQQTDEIANPSATPTIITKLQ